ncbi:MAG: hypothetical protein NVSMB57_11380 [Actinomycetota bacterium]
MSTPAANAERRPVEERGADLLARRRIALDKMPRARPILGYAIALVGTAAVTLIFRPFRGSLAPLSEAFGYLTLVVLVAWVGGLAPSLLTSVAAFLAFDYFFLPPFDSFSIRQPEYVTVLFVQIGMAVLVSWLLGRTRERIRAAEMRESELAALQELGGELVGRIPGPETYQAVMRRLGDLLGFEDAALMVADEETNGELRIEATIGRGEERSALASRMTDYEGVTARLPLSVGHSNLGILLLWGKRPPLRPGESRVLRAFCDQLALVLERDRLERVAAKADRFRSTEKLRRALLTAVSHDLRSPLSAIKTSVTDLLDADMPVDPAYHREVLQAVDSEVDRLNGLIANLLDMSRIEAGMLRARMQTVDVGESIAQGVAQAKRRWPAVRFAVSIDEAASVAEADPVYLDRIVTNLLDNAARSSVEQEQTSIEIEARARYNGWPVVRVIDHGPGVPAALVEHLFHPFSQLDERRSRLGPGLGLAICKGFVSSMGGDIWIEQTPGGGATFAFSLRQGQSS